MDWLHGVAMLAPRHESLFPSLHEDYQLKL